MKNELKISRELFIKRICKEKGWSHNNLTPDQMLTITMNTEYINPLLKQK